jgi:thiamine-phosphate pyrophosphorylase
MLVVVTNPTPLEQEATLLNALFEEGLELLHLRKKGYSEQETGEFIEKINPAYYSRISLHYHHALAFRYGIKRLHFIESERRRQAQANLIGLKAQDMVLSTSIHSIEAYLELSPAFKYALLGPVFNSISKENYPSVLEGRAVTPHLRNDVKLVAIGGITGQTLVTAHEMGFNGAAVLGDLWQEPELAMDKFRAIQAQYKTLFKS